MIRRTMRHRERGQAIVEFAFAASIGLTLIFGVVEFGRALFAYDLVANAARIGTRYAIVSATVPTNCSDPSVGTTPCETAITNYIKAKSPGIDTNEIAAANLHLGGTIDHVPRHGASGLQRDDRGRLCVPIRAAAIPSDHDAQYVPDGLSQ